MAESRKWILLGALLFVCVALYLLGPVLMPFVVAALLAYLMDPLVNRLQAWKMPRLLAVVIIFLLLIVLFVMFLLFFIPLLEQQLVVLLHKLPDFFAWIQDTVMPWIQNKLGIQLHVNLPNMKNAVTQHLSQSANVVGSIWSTITASSLTVIAWATNLVLIPVVMFYLLRDWDKLVQGIRDLLPRRAEPTIAALVKESDEVLSAFLRGQLLVMLALGILYSIGLWIVGLDLALLIGMIGGAASIVPYLGFIVGITAASIAAFFQFHAALPILYVVIVFLVSQSIESMFLTPTLIGDKIGLHPVAVIFAILVGGQLFGFVGILLALPVAAVIMVFIRHFQKQYIASDLYGESTPSEGTP